MNGSNWDPLPADITGPAWDLVAQVRFLMDVEGLTVEQLAYAEDIPCSGPTLMRLLAGELLPSRDLLTAIAQRCGADPRDLLDLHDRANEAAADARRIAAVQARRVTRSGGRVPDSLAQAAMEAEQQAAEDEFWGPIGEAERWSDQFGDSPIGRMLRRPTPEEREARREEIRMEAARREERGPAISRIRPTIIAVVLLTSFAVGIILATVAIGGPA
jgi:transcriptional regulator with XRE-family HTH domain